MRLLWTSPVIPKALEPWLAKQPHRYRIRFRLRYALLATRWPGVWLYNRIADRKS